MDNQKEIKDLAKILAKSMYKSVKKALSAQGKKYSEKAYSNEGKEVVEDILDENYIAEAKEKVPPRRTKQMNKAKVDEGLSPDEKTRARVKRQSEAAISATGKRIKDTQKKVRQRLKIRERKEQEQKQKQNNKESFNYKEMPNPKLNVGSDEATELRDIAASEKGIDKLKKFKKKIKKNRCWEGYEPTPGKKPYSEGSCRKKDK